MTWFSQDTFACLLEFLPLFLQPHLFGAIVNGIAFLFLFPFFFSKEDLKSSCSLLIFGIPLIFFYTLHIKWYGMLPTFSISALNLLIIIRKFLIRFFESVSCLILTFMIILSLQAMVFLALFVPHNFWMKDSFCGSAETEIILLSRYMYNFPCVDL